MTLQTPKALIVDDERAVRSVVGRWLVRWGYAVRDVASAVEALTVMESDPADVIICDINMPEHDGLWLAEQVHARWPATSIVMATGLDDPAIVTSSRRIGAVAYVTKPFDPDLLRQAVDHAAGRLHFRPSAER